MKLLKLANAVPNFFTIHKYTSNSLYSYVLFASRGYNWVEIMCTNYKYEAT